MAVNQKPISVRLNLDLMSALDEFCVSHNLTRNRAINGAVYLLLQHGMPNCWRI